MAVEVGPFSFKNSISIPVGLSRDVCQSADVAQPEEAGDCFRFFLHQGDDGRGTVRQQDPDARPMSATPTGDVELAVAGGWSPIVAVWTARGALGSLAAAGVLLLLWRLLAGASAGGGFSPRMLWCVRGIGWLVLVSGLVDTAFAALVGASRFGYSIETFGPGPHLIPRGAGDVDLTRLFLGGLILIIAEVLRRSVRDGMSARTA